MIPVSLSTSINPGFKLVEWKLGNTCNFNCSFCSIENKSGSEYWLELAQYISVCKKLMDTTSEKIFFQFTGGEPSLYPKLIDLLKFIKEQGHYTCIFSNGSRTLRWWEEIAELNLLDVLNLTIHVEQGIDVDHIINVIKLFEQKPVFVFAQSTAPVAYFDQAYLAHKKILENTCVVANLKPITTGYSHDSYIDDYSSSQIEILKKNIVVKSLNYNKIKPLGVKHFRSTMSLTYDNGLVKKYQPYSLIAEGLNSFTGWNCSIGMNSLSIVHDKIYRGMCKQGGILNHITDQDISFASNEIICNLDRCSCAGDLLEKKVRFFSNSGKNATLSTGS